MREKKISLAIAAGSGILALLLCLLSFLILRQDQKTLFISEVCGSNTRVPNEDGYILDYVEIRNDGVKPLNLGGYHLNDGNPHSEFQFPDEVILEGGECLVVWLGMDAPDGSTAYYGAFSISSTEPETIVLSNRSSRLVDVCETNGFTDNTCLIRLENGGFGMSEHLTPGKGNTDIEFEGVLSNRNESLVSVCLSEIVSQNTLYPDPAGFYSDLIELYNYGDADINLKGFSLSDDLDQVGYVFEEDRILSPGAYLTVWLRETSFNLAKEGEPMVLLRSADGAVVDYIGVPPLEEDQAMCLKGDMWVFSDIVTPGFENSEIGYEEYLASMDMTASTLVISEFMAENKTILADPYGDFCDWIEIMNLGEEPVDLNGLFLSDDPEELTKYPLPNQELGSGECLLIYGGSGEGKNGLYLGFNLSSYGETLCLSGAGGVILDQVTYETALADRSCQLDLLTGEMQWTLYASPGYRNTGEGYEEFCCRMESCGDLAIWEVMTTNDWYLQETEDGKCYDFVEIKNISSHDVDLKEYSITDSFKEPSMFSLPDRVLQSGETTVILLSGDPSLTGTYVHGSFTLSGEEESLYLYQGDRLIDYVYLFDIPNQGSFGRYDAGHGFYFMEPTPGYENEVGYRRICEEPTYNLEPGIYETDEPLYLELDGNGGEIYYSLDGSVPTTESLHYDGPIEINKTTVIRSVQMQNGYLSSDILTLNYILNEGDAMPVLCLTTDPENLWSGHGIYRSSWSIKEIEVAGNLSYYGWDGDFDIDCGISMHGMTSLLVSEKKSFTVRFRNNYDGPLEFPFFPDQDYDTYYSLLLRADVESTFPTMIRDALWGRIANDYSEHCMGQDYKYCALYLNGEFWGIYTVREHSSAEYYAARRHVPIETCTMVKSFYQLGDPLWEFNDWLTEHPVSEEENWEYAKTVLDMESFADWMIFQAYTGNKDVNGNMRYFYTEEDGLWRCAIYDVDLGMFSGETMKVPLYAVQHGNICRKLLQSEEFQKLFLQRASYFLNGPLSDGHMIQIINEMADEIYVEIDKESERWGCPVSTWERFVRELREFCDGRARRMVWGIQEYVPMTSSELQEYFGDIVE